MMRGIKLVALLFLFSLSCIAQNYDIRLFTKDQGLPDPYVYALQQDQQGFLWIATGKGLSKFDGQIFTPIPSPAGDALIYSSAIQKNGTLWFGTSSGNLFSIKPGAAQVTSSPGSLNASITRIVASAYSDDLYLNVLGRGIFVQHQNTISVVNGSDEYQVNAIEELQKNLLLAGTSEGLFLVNLSTQTFIKVAGLNEAINGIQRLKSRKNTFVMLLDRTRFYEIELGSAGQLVSKKALSEHTSPEETKAFHYDETGESLYTNLSNETLVIDHLKSHRQFVPDETHFLATATVFFEDDEKNTWIGTMGKGLYRISTAAYTSVDLGEPVFVISEDKTGKRYYGSGNGIMICDQAGNLLKRLTELKHSALGKVTALHYDDQMLWIGTENKGLFVLNPENEQTLRVEFSPVAQIAINAITGHRDHVCVSTNLDGVFTYEHYRLREHFNVQNSLLHNNVYYALRHQDGKIFYATHNTSFNYSEGKQLYEIDPKAMGLISDFNGFAQGKNGELYIATNGDGVYVMHEKTIRPFGANAGLQSEFCEGLVVDDENNLWIMQRYQLYKYYTREKVLRQIRAESKDQTMFYPNAFYKGKNGELCFGTSKGLLRFNSKESKDKLAIPYLVSLHIQDSLMDQPGNNIDLPYGHYRVSMEFSALGFKNAEDILFKYKLEGRDEHWSPLSKIRKAEFSKLSEGTYAFKVIACNSEGFASPAMTLYTFRIAAPYWKNPLFWALMIAVLIILVLFMIRVRTARLVEAKNKLEVMVTEKTRELRAEKELVEQKNAVIAHQNAEIRDSITYAKRIQDALLPGKESYVHNKNMFVFFQPRDIVSGDYYWIGEVNGVKLVVAADCTGHGVPGALMSMVGTTLLNKIILEKKITQPKEILKELDAEIKQALKQHTEEATRDGMDMSLLCIDEKNKKVIYAGAMRPVFFVRNKELIEYGATKHAIGGFSYGKEKTFEETEINVRKGDMLYLFSDGYADQFGGEKGKKLMLKNFKKIVTTISDMELADQADNLKRVYNNWKGELEQVDDVLVIGLRM